MRGAGGVVPLGSLAGEAREAAALRIEVERARADDDEALARTLEAQIAALLSLPKGEGKGESQGGGGGGSRLAKSAAAANEHCNPIVEGMFLGDLTAANDPGILAACGVTHVVDLANTVDTAARGKERNVHYEISKEEGDWAAACPSIAAKLVVRVEDTDEAPLRDHFDAMSAFIRTARASGGVVLVHCFRGKSRSATAVIQYLMQCEGLSLKTAHGLVKAARPMVQLNVGFRKQLMELEAELHPGSLPSMIFKLKSRAPVLSSDRRRANSRSPPRLKRAETANQKETAGPAVPYTPAGCESVPEEKNSLSDQAGDLDASIAEMEDIRRKQEESLEHCLEHIPILQQWKETLGGSHAQMLALVRADIAHHAAQIDALAAHTVIPRQAELRALRTQAAKVAAEAKVLRAALAVRTARRAAASFQFTHHHVSLGRVIAQTQGRLSLLTSAQQERQEERQEECQGELRPGTVSSDALSSLDKGSDSAIVHEAAGSDPAAGHLGCEPAGGAPGVLQARSPAKSPSASAPSKLQLRMGPREVDGAGESDQRVDKRSEGILA